MPKPSTIDKFRDSLWDDIDSITPAPTSAERVQLLRYRSIFTYKLENPASPNTKIVEMLREKFGVCDAQAYRDIGQTEVHLASIRSSEKAWVRYIVVETLKEAIVLAKEQQDADVMAKAAGLLGKYSRLDQEDQPPLPYEDIVPQQIEFINDPSVLGLPSIDNPRQQIEKIKKKYLNAEAIEYEEVKK